MTSGRVDTVDRRVSRFAGARVFPRRLTHCAGACRHVQKIVGDLKQQPKVSTVIGDRFQFIIVRAAIHQTEDGPVVPSGSSFVPGESLFFSAALDGYRVSLAKRVHITWQVQAVDANGVPIMETGSGKIESPVEEEDKEWMPIIRQTVLVPPFAPSGSYKIRVTAKDELSGASAMKEVDFVVRGHQVEPSDTLVVRNFRYYRSEEDTRPLQIAAYRPGDTVWARFDITGYKLSSGNQLHVSYSVAVSGPGGRVLFSQPEPTVEKVASFYPQQYVPCLINLSLQPNIRPEEYAITVTVKDHIGNQEGQVREVFRVE